MRPQSERVRFQNTKGVELAGIIDWPSAAMQRFVVFCHCFTCTKDLKAIVRISRGLASGGTAVLRFDFTGLGESQGDFSRSTFDDNQADLLAAIEFLTQRHQPPRFLIGHSLGGAAAISCAKRIPNLLGLVNIASPANTMHLANFLIQSAPEIETVGEGQVTIGGRRHKIRREMVEVLRSVELPKTISASKLPLLIFFSPNDETLPWQHALEMFRLAGGPASLISLPGADHLLVNHPADVEFVARTMNAWFERLEKYQISTEVT